MAAEPQDTSLILILWPLLRRFEDFFPNEVYRKRLQLKKRKNFFFLKEKIIFK
jgi:hypothetical protein